MILRKLISSLLLAFIIQLASASVDDPYIVFGTDHQLLARSSPTKNVHLFRNGTGSIRGVECDARREFIFWTQSLPGNVSILRSKWSEEDVRIFTSTDLSAPESLAFDWISNNIYFTHASLKYIGVCTTAVHYHCAVLVQDGVEKLREIVVHPEIGQIFWSDWGSQPKIMSAGMDGSTPTPIITRNLQWPNGLALDNMEGNLYWADANLDKIESCNLDGSERRAIITIGVTHPFSLKVFGDKLYWSDFSLNQIESCDKNGEGHRVVFKNDGPIYGIAICHTQLENSLRRNSCELNPCSHICVLGPVNARPAFRCLCPKQMALVGDGWTCSKVIPNRTCNANEFQCNSGQQCIHESRLCDHVRDCSDGSDEIQCHFAEAITEGIMAFSAEEAERSDITTETVENPLCENPSYVGISIIWVLVCLIISCVCFGAGMWCQKRRQLKS